MKFIYAEYNMYNNSIDITTFDGLTAMWQKMAYGLLRALNVNQMHWQQMSRLNTHDWHLTGICKCGQMHRIVQKFGNNKVLAVFHSQHLHFVKVFSETPFRHQCFYFSKTSANCSKSVLISKCCGQAFSHFPHLIQSLAFPCPCVCT